MPKPEQLLLTYLQLARASQLRQQYFIRDKFLVLSGVTATELGWSDIAAGCRERVLLHNPRHLVRRWSDLEQAGNAERFGSYLKQLRRKYSPEKAEHMLQSLGIAAAPVERAADPRDRAALLVAELEKVSSRSRTSAPASSRAARTQQAPPRPAVQQVAGARRSLGRAWWPLWIGMGALAMLAAWFALTGAR